jgi:hypothetical protein
VGQTQDRHLSDHVLQGRTMPLIITATARCSLHLLCCAERICFFGIFTAKIDQKAVQ